METLSFWRCARCREPYAGPRQASNPDAGVGALVCWRCYNNHKVGAPAHFNRTQRRAWDRQRRRDATIERVRRRDGREGPSWLPSVRAGRGGGV